MVIRVTRLADYAILILACFSANRESSFTARDIADRACLPVPVASKVLKLLARAGLLASRRGIKGGYELARSPKKMNVAEIIRAVEGPIALTECTSITGSCHLENGCPVRTNWRVINDAIHSALESVTLAEMTGPLHKPLINLAWPKRRVRRL